MAIDPRDTHVIVGSSNDYCGVYNDGADAIGAPLPVGPIWLGYYRSENGGAASSQLAGTRLPRRHVAVRRPCAHPHRIGRRSRAGVGRPRPPVRRRGGVGRPGRHQKTFGDVWVATFDNPDGPSGATVNDGKEFKRSVTVVAQGSSAPNLLGMFQDKTAIEADRTIERLRGNVYFANSSSTATAANTSTSTARPTMARPVLSTDTC